jgi:hypothetical protein
VTDRGKHSSLLLYLFIYDRKKFYTALTNVIKKIRPNNIGSNVTSTKTIVKHAASGANYDKKALLHWPKVTV